MQGRVLTKADKAKFLKKLGKTAGNVSKACQMIGISRAAAYSHKTTDADFATKWDEAIESGLDDVEEEMHRRGVKGVLEPVFYRGKMVAKIRHYSDALLMAQLRARRPEVYRDNFQINATISGSLNLDIESVIAEVYGPKQSIETAETAVNGKD